MTDDDCWAMVDANPGGAPAAVKGRRLDFSCFTDYNITQKTRGHKRRYTLERSSAWESTSATKLQRHYMHHPRVAATVLKLAYRRGSKLDGQIL